MLLEPSSVLYLGIELCNGNQANSFTNDIYLFNILDIHMVSNMKMSFLQ